MGACVSQRGSHDTPDCGGYGNRQPKTTEQKGPVRGKNPHPGHHAEPSNEQRLDLRSVDHTFEDAGAGYRGLQTGVDCFLCLSPVPESSEFPLSQGGGAPGSRRLLRARHGNGETKRSAQSVSGRLSSRATSNKPDLSMSFRDAVKNKERQPLVVCCSASELARAAGAGDSRESDGPAAYGARERV